MFLFAHIFSMNNTFPYLKTNLFFTPPFSPLFSPKKKDIPLLLGTPPRPLQDPNGSWKIFPPINGPLILHEPMKIDNDFFLQWK